MNKRKILILKVAVLLSLIFVVNLNFVLKLNNHLRNVDRLQPKISDLTSPFAIDDLPGSLNDWMWVESQVWFGGGNGSKTNPYIIDDITIDGQNSGTCIEIKNSNKYFMIRNCTFYNSGPGSYPNIAAGIRLNNVSNGKIINNEIINNGGIGIYLYPDIENIIIANNTVNNNGNTGIRCSRGIALNVFNNSVNYNEGTGISLSSNNSIISKNEVIGNLRYGFSITGNYNNISKNIIANNGFELPTTHYEGIHLSSSCNNTLLQNTIINNNAEGINVRWCQFNRFIQNIIKNNGEDGILLSGTNINSRNNVIFNNTIENNGEIGLLIEGNANWNLIYNNKFSLNNVNAMDNANNNKWDNGSLGNYWDDYPFEDANSDGIGDIPYDVPPAGGSMDNYPIWYDGVDLAPNIIINSPSMNDAFGLLAPDFNVTINDASSINTTWYTIDGGLTNYTFSGLTGTVNQTAWGNKGTEIMTLRFYANNSLGYVGFKGVVIWKDLIVPNIAINSPTPNQLCGIATPSFSLTIDEPNLQIKRYSLNGRPNITFTTESQFSQSEWDNIENGTVVITFYAIDKAGNVNSSQIIVRKDAIMPYITIISPIQDEIFGRTSPKFNITIIEDDFVSTWYTLEGIGGTFNFTGLIGDINQNEWDNASEGEITITFYALDEAGNIGTESVVVIKSIPSQPAIPGYNIHLLFGAISFVSIIVLKKQRKK